MSDPLEVLRRLEAVIASRKGADPASSHTAKLFAKGPSKCAQKFGEEAIEAVIAAAERDRAEMVTESADALYHLLVMLAAQDTPFDAVLAELERREGTSGVAEKAARLRTEVVEVSAPEEIAECIRIRLVVFVGEQGVSLADEQDGQDGICRHYLAYQDGKAVGAARMKPIEDAAGPAMKLQRIAVMPGARGTGAGKALVRAMMAAAGPGARVILDAQTSAIAFYEPLGFAAEGPEFLDAGIPHRRMAFGGGA